MTLEQTAELPATLKTASVQTSARPATDSEMYNFVLRCIKQSPADRVDILVQLTNKGKRGDYEPALEQLVAEGKVARDSRGADITYHVTFRQAPLTFLWQYLPRAYNR